MQIVCTNCKSRIRVPEKALGKRVKCPKCATPLQIPAALPEGEGAAPATSIAPSSPPPAPPETAEEPFDNDNATEVTATPPPSKPGKSPPPLKSSKRGRPSDDEIEDEDEVEEREEEEERPSRRKRRRDSDDDDLDVRRRRPRKSKSVNGFAMASMILGIVSIATGFGSCCCGPVSLVAILCAILAIVFGFMGKTPGSETYAWIGIGCGIAALVLAAIAIALILLSIGMNGMMQFNNMNQPRRFG